MPSSPPTTFEAACDDCVEALEALRRALASGGKDPKTGQTADMAAKKHYEALGITLRAYNAPENWDRRGNAHNPLPRLLAFELGQIVDDLLAGRIPTGIKNIFFGRKRPGDSAVQRRAKEAAARYLVAVEDGLIDDETPTERVSGHFGVAPHTVRRWRRDLRDSVELKRGPHAATSPEALKAILVQHMEENSKLYKARRHVKLKK